LIDPALISLPWRISSRLVQQSAPDGIELEGDCLIWVGKWTTGNGYGKVGWEGKHRVAHRVIYEIFHGPVDPKLLLDHRCLNRACCQPLHLEPVTTKVNTHRGKAVLFTCA
jgi:hypothetical protein